MLRVWQNLPITKQPDLNIIKIIHINARHVAWMEKCMKDFGQKFWKEDVTWELQVEDGG